MNESPHCSKIDLTVWWKCRQPVDGSLGEVSERMGVSGSGSQQAEQQRSRCKGKHAVWIEGWLVVIKEHKMTKTGKPAEDQKMPRHSVMLSLAARRAWYQGAGTNGKARSWIVEDHKRTSNRKGKERHKQKNVRRLKMGKV